MFEFLLRINRPSKARAEAAIKWAQRSSHVELEAESLRHKIQTLQRLPRYKQTTQDNARNLLLFKGQLQQIEGHATLASFVRKVGLDMRKRKGKMGILDEIAVQKKLERAKQIHFRWQTDLFRSDWVMSQDLSTRMFLLWRQFHAVKWNLMFRAYFVSDSIALKMYLFLNRLLK